MKENSKIKVVVIDDDLRALNRMKILLTSFNDIEIIEQTTDADYGIKFIINQQPHLAFVDIEMPQKTGLEIAEIINKSAVETKVVFITAHDHYAIKAIKTQVFDYLLKPVDLHILKKTILRYQNQLQSNLSNRELQIIRLIAKGLNSKEIGDQLFLSKHTVDTHRRKILQKTESKNTVELLDFARNCGII